MAGIDHNQGAVSHRRLWPVITLAFGHADHRCIRHMQAEFALGVVIRGGDPPRAVSRLLRLDFAGEFFPAQAQTDRAALLGQDIAQRHENEH